MSALYNLIFCPGCSLLLDSTVSLIDLGPFLIQLIHKQRGTPEQIGICHVPHDLVIILFSIILEGIPEPGIILRPTGQQGPYLVAGNVF